MNPIDRRSILKYSAAAAAAATGLPGLVRAQGGPFKIGLITPLSGPQEFIGSYVKNGAEDISISLSFFFQTDETNRWVKAMQFNNRVHRHLGLQLSPIGKSRFRDNLKASTLNVVTATTSSLKKLRRSAAA